MGAKIWWKSLRDSCVDGLHESLAGGEVGWINERQIA